LLPDFDQDFRKLPEGLVEIIRIPPVWTVWTDAIAALSL
jgi:hypothetical protein